MTGQTQNAAEAPTGRRGRSRLRTCLPAQITTLHGMFKAELEDISLTGARVRITDRRGNDGTPRKGGAIILEWFDFEAFGEISWGSGAWLGIRFDEIIAPSVLIQTRDFGDEQRASRQALDAMACYMRDWSQGRVR